MKKKIYLDEVRQKAVDLYKQGHTLAAISRRRGMPRDVKTVRRWVEDAEVPLRGNPQRFPREEIVQRLANGASRADVAREYGCSAKYLSNLALGRLKGVEPLAGRTPNPEPAKKKPAKKKPAKKKPAKKKPAKKKKAPPKKPAKKKAPPKKPAKKKRKSTT